MDTTGPIQDLPPELIAKIFGYLCQKDRLTAGTTCRHLRDVCKLPEFWRNCYSDCRFIISDSHSHSGRAQLAQEKERILVYMKTFGVYLLHLTITVSDQGSITLGQILSQTKKILSEIENLCKNEHLRLQMFNWCGYSRDPCIRPKKREAILDALLRMLVPQEEISVVGFEQTCLGENEGCDFLLKVATQINTGKITTLKLYNFFNKYFEDLNTLPKFSAAIVNCRCLECVALNYIYLSNDVLKTLTSSNTSPSLSRILLYINGEDVTRHILPSTLPDWQLAVKQRPQLHVGMDIESTYGSCSYVDYILPSIPLVNLSLKRTHELYIEEAVVQITADIQHQHHRLKVFVLSLKNPWNWRRAWSRPKPL